MLVTICIGFYQSFLGLDYADYQVLGALTHTRLRGTADLRSIVQIAEDTVSIIQSMANVSTRQERVPHLPLPPPLSLDFVPDPKCAQALMQSPDFAGFEKFQHPFGLILFYM